ncbi:MAG TPA: ABC transporter permease [Thermoanaerobaculia bacterium]|jgi:predicted permease|nr:ABC transporter permease [Thermoanaerobaculia bacterium]
MRLLDRLRLRLRSLFHRREVEAELRAEIEFHLEQEIAELVAKGLDPRQARSEARRRLGDLSRYEEECRDARRTQGLDTLLQDLRYGLRGLRASPLFTAVVVLSLALGIGVNTAIFTLTDALLVRDLPVRDPDGLMVIGDPARTNSLSSGGLRADLLSVPMYRALRERDHVFSGLLASGRTGRITLGDETVAKPEHVQGRLVSANYFAVLGVPSFAGRTFGAEEDRYPCKEPVVVVSHDFWSRRFGRDPHLVGQRLLLNSSPFTVIGVAASGFLGDVVGVATDVWVPLGAQPQLNPGRDFLSHWDVNWVLLIGRRAPGVTPAAAAQATRALFSQLVATRADGAMDPSLVANPDELRALTLPVAPGRGGLSAVRARFSEPLSALFAMVAVVLLVACVNVANLLLERATARQKEITVRLALGAGRLRLVRQLLTESVVLALLGGALGVVLAFWADVALLQLAGLRRSAALDPWPNLRVLAFTAVVSVATGVLFGLAPAFRATRVELAPALRERSRTVGGGRPGRWPLGRILVVSQLALSLLLLTGAGLFVRTLSNLRRLDLGYRPEGILMLQVDPVVAGYEGDAMGPLVSELLRRLRAVPGVTAATLSENGLFSGTESGTRVTLEGVRPAMTAGDDNIVFYDRVGPDYFRVVGIPILRGRGIGAGDVAGSVAVAVINEAMARAYYRGRDPLGQRFTEVDGPGVVYQVVGVARDVHDHDLRTPVAKRFYLPLRQSPQTASAFNVEIRTARPRALLAPVRETVRAVDPRIAVIDVAPLADNVAELVRYDHLVARLASAFGLLALLLAAVGLYGVVSHTIARRTHEIGIRMVLGAGHRGVLWMVLADTMLMALAGIACGLPVALLAGRAVTDRLYGISAHDLPTLATATLVLAAVAALAGVVPGSRAARVDPSIALRHE